MFGLGLPEGVIFVIIIASFLYAVFMFCLPFFVFTIRAETIRTNQLLEEIIKRLPPVDNPAPAPATVQNRLVTCENCRAELPVKEFIEHIKTCNKKA